MSQNKLRIIFIVFTLVLIGVFSAGTFVLWAPMIPLEHRLIIIGIVSLVLIFISSIFYLITNTVRKKIMEQDEIPVQENEESVE